MARKALQPITIGGIEFDALIDETKTMSATIPVYPVEEGFPVSDTIILNPIALQMTLYITNTPVTWLYRHGTSNTRVESMCERIENMWLDKELVKVVTNDAIYTSMGITSISIKKSKDIGYAREISITMQKVRITEKSTVTIPADILQSGESEASAGTASTSTTSSSSSTTTTSSTTDSSESTSSSDTSSSDASSSASILYGIASGLSFI